MSTIDHFDAFLETTVNLKQWKLDTLDGRVGAILTALGDDEVIGPMFQTYFKQGSWAHQTIIEPVGDYDEFDADFLLHLSVDEDWDEEDPGRYLRDVRAAFRRHSTYKTMVEKKNRCVRIKYANSCHIDVVPYLILEDENGDERQVIINYKDKELEDTNPEGLTAWMAERDVVTNGNFRAAVRLMKYLRDYKNTFDCKSVILTTLMGGRVQPANRATRYADIPTTFVSILEDLNTYLSEHDTMPLIDDPSCPGTSFDHRWSEPKFQTFKTYIEKYAGWAQEAQDAADDDEAVKAWQKMFGDNFVAVEVREVAKTLQATRIRKAVVSLRAGAAPDEEFIEDKGYDFSPRYSATIEGKAKGSNWYRYRPIRTSKQLHRGMDLVFTLQTDAPPPYDVLWKVRNHGEVAGTKGELRGQLIRSNTDVATRRHETTRYPGRHFIEVYVVKNGPVVASDHHDVVIQ